jgi:hypothetical protein
MTERTFTIEEIKQIFRAGVRQGEDQASAYDWGSSPKQSEDEAFKEAISDIIYDRKVQSGRYISGVSNWPTDQEVASFVGES